MTTEDSSQRELIDNHLTITRLAKGIIHVPIDESNYAFYQDIKDNIRPFDLIGFRGGDIISDLISELEQDRLDIGTFSHVGMIVTSDILPYYVINNEKFYLKPNHLYIFESTFTYYIPGITEGIPDITTGRGKWGVQLRDFEEIIPRYITNQKTKIAWCRLLNNPFDRIGDESDDSLRNRRILLQEKFEEFFHEYEGRLYKINLIDLFAAMFPILRPLSKIQDTIFNKLFKILQFCGLSGNGPSGWQFCSELVANVYQLIGVIPESFETRDILPVDFFGYDEDGLPSLVDSPIFIRDWTIPGEPAIHYDNDKTYSV